MPRSFRRPLSRGPVALLFLVGLSACDLRQEWTEARQTRHARAEGIATLERLFAASLAGDEAALKTVATDSIAAEIMTYRRVGAMAPFNSAAGGIQPGNATLAGDRLEVEFHYDRDGEPYKGVSRFQRQGGTWKVYWLYMISA